MSVELNPHNHTNMNFFFLQFVAAENFLRSPSEGAAEGGCGGNSAAPERSAERSEAVHFRFRFLDLCIRFGKMISKVCEGFNSEAKVVNI